MKTLHCVDMLQSRTSSQHRTHHAYCIMTALSLTSSYPFFQTHLRRKQQSVRAAAKQRQTGTIVLQLHQVDLYLHHRIYHIKFTLYIITLSSKLNIIYADTIISTTSNIIDIFTSMKDTISFIPTQPYLPKIYNLHLYHQTK